MFNVSGQAFVTNLREVSPKLVTGDLYCNEKIGDNEYKTTFIKGKFVHNALVKLYSFNIKNKDKIYIKHSIIKTNEYTNKEGKLIKNLELTLFDIDMIDNDNINNEKGKFDR